MADTMSDDDKILSSIANFNLASNQLGMDATLQFRVIARLVAKKLIETTATRDKFLRLVTEEHELVAEQIFIQLRGRDALVTALQSKLEEFKTPEKVEAANGEDTEEVPTEVDPIEKVDIPTPEKTEEEGETKVDPCPPEDDKGAE